MTPLSFEDPVHALSRFTDAQAMGEVWRARLPALLRRPFEFESCNVQYARCRTYLNPQSWHKSFLCVCYEFDGATQCDGTYKPMLYGRAYLDGRSQREFAALNHLDGAQHLPDLDMIVWPFPNDPKLPQLLELLDSDRVIDHFPYAEMPFARGAIVGVKTTVIRYRPEQRCILRYDIEYGSQRNQYVLYAKVFADDNGVGVFSRMQRCYDLADVIAARVARPLGYSATTGAVWQEELRGEPLVAALDAGRYDLSVAAIGHCLARLHAADVPTDRLVTREARLDDATKKSQKLAQLLPALDGPLAALIACADSDLTNLAPAPTAVIHGDVHVGQFLLTPDGALALFDFDEWSQGDPAQDLADLIVDLQVVMSTCAKAKMNHVRSANVANVLLASYRADAAWPVSDETILWHARIQLINKAYRGAIQQEPDWREKVSALIAIATQGIDLGIRRGSP